MGYVSYVRRDPVCQDCLQGSEKLTLFERRIGQNSGCDYCGAIPNPVYRCMPCWMVLEAKEEQRKRVDALRHKHRMITDEVYRRRHELDQHLAKVVSVRPDGQAVELGCLKGPIVYEHRDGVW